MKGVLSGESCPRLEFSSAGEPTANIKDNETGSSVRLRSLEMFGLLR